MIDVVPFDIPEECGPNPHNVVRHWVPVFCGVECMNMAHPDWGFARCGAPEAAYGPGSRRVGVGWREEGGG